MDIDKEELEIEINHKQALLRALRARRRPLEIQAAKKGGDTPPDGLNEIAEITIQIQAQEEEVAHLRSLAVVGTEPQAELEYRVLLAEAWDTPQARPSTTGKARLELARVRLGILT